MITSDMRHLNDFLAGNCSFMTGNLVWVFPTAENSEAQLQVCVWGGGGFRINNLATKGFIFCIVVMNIFFLFQN